MLLVEEQVRAAAQLLSNALPPSPALLPCPCPSPCPSLPPPAPVPAQPPPPASPPAPPRPPAAAAAAPPPPPPGPLRQRACRGRGSSSRDVSPRTADDAHSSIPAHVSCTPHAWPVHAACNIGCPERTPRVPVHVAVGARQAAQRRLQRPALPLRLRILGAQRLGLRAWNAGSGASRSRAGQGSWRSVGKQPASTTASQLAAHLLAQPLPLLRRFDDVVGLAVRLLTCMAHSSGSRAWRGSVHAQQARN